MLGIILHILYAFKRDALFIGTTLATLCCAGISVFLGSNAVVEANEAKIIYTAGSSRIIVILGFIIFISFYIRRMFENHEIEVILSHSVSRIKAVLSMFVGFSIVLFFLILPIFFVLSLLNCNFVNIAIWTLSIYCEGLIVLVFALCCSLIIKSFVHSLMGCFIIYLVGRIIGSFVVYLKLAVTTNLQIFMESFLKLLSIFIPRLDLFGKSSWLIYGDYTSKGMLFFASQTLISCLVFLLLAMIDFKNKKF